MMVEDKGEAKFNEGMAQLMRINNIHNISSECHMKGDYDGWLASLSALFVELYPCMNSDEVLKVKGLFTQYSNLIANKHSPPDKKELYVKLRDLDCELRKVKDVHGFGMPKKQKGMVDED